MKGDAPDLDLTDMGLLVVAAELERPGVAADDHVAQGHGGEAAPLGQPAREAAVEFERACAAWTLPPEQSVNAPATRPTSVVGAAHV